MPVPVLAALGVAQGIMGFASQAGKESPIDNVKPSDITNYGKRYERIFRNLADDYAAQSKMTTDEDINRSSADTIGRTERLFKDPVTRFRAANVVNSQASMSKIKSNLNTVKGRNMLLEKAFRAGVTADTMDLRVWNNMLRLKQEQQKAYNKNQMANAQLIGAGMSNIVGAFDETNVFKDPSKTAKAEENEKKLGEDEQGQYETAFG